MALADKLSPGRFSDMSDLMAALVGYLLGTQTTEPKILDIDVTSDDVVLAMAEGEIGFNQIIGSWADVERNFHELFAAAELTADEHAAALALMAQRFHRARL